MEIKFEKWVYDQNQEEIHFFIEGTNTYLFGYNPAYFTEKQILEVLEILKGKLDGS